MHEVFLRVAHRFAAFVQRAGAHFVEAVFCRVLAPSLDAPFTEPPTTMAEERIIPVPPLPRHREGEILNELPNSAGLVLWQDVRHVRDWAESTPGQRRQLFTRPSGEAVAKRKHARACAGELAGPLDAFAAMKVDPLAVKTGSSSI